MSDLLLYLIKANVALALFYLGYHLLLRKLTFYRINRYYLIFALVFSVVYPFISIDQWLAADQDAPPQLLLTLSDWQQLQLPEEGNILSSVFSSAYWISIGLFGLLFLIKLMGIGRIHLRSVPAQWNRFTYRKSREKISPFSFLTHIYFNPTMYAEDEYERIFSHEQVHVRQLHSLDILLAEISLIFFWYNPFCWLIRKAIQENIEFITDQRVLSSGIDKKSYQYSLIHISTSAHPSYLGSHFNFKNLKKRIIMMNKKQSSKMQLGKYAFTIPVVVLASLILGVSKEYVKAEGSSNSTQDTLRANDPLYVVDGTFLSEGAPIKLKSTEIQSIEVITDAAAHNIYGTKAQNGMIKVTTKKEEPLVVDGIKGEPLYVVNGVKQASEKARNYLPDEIAFVNVLKGKTAVDAYGDEGKNGVIEITTKDKSGIPPTPADLKNIVLILEGEKISYEQFLHLKPDDIERMEVLKGESAIARYGEEGKEGVIQIVTTKNPQDPVVQEVSSPDNKISVKISTDSLQLSANLENYKEDKEPVVMGIKNNKITSLEGAEENVLIYVDGEKLTKNELSQLDQDNIDAMTVFKGKSAIEQYGEEGKDGVIEITTKSKN